MKTAKTDHRLQRIKKQEDTTYKLNPGELEEQIQAVYNEAMTESEDDWSKAKLLTDRSTTSKNSI